LSNKVSYVFIAQDLYSKVATKVNAVTSKAQQQFKKLEEQTKRNARSTGTLTNKVGKLGRKLKAGAIAGAKAFGSRIKQTGKDLLNFAKIATIATAGLTVKFGKDFQTAMADVSAITGAVGKDLQFFSDESLRLAKSSATAQTEVAGAFKAVASAKSELLKDPKGLSRVVEQVLLLKNASGIELAEAVQVGVGALNQFNVGADQASRFVNVLAAGSKVGASEVRDTGLALKEAATIAKQNAKLSFEELNSTIQVLAKSEIKGGKAGTALKNVFLGLETSGEKKLMPSVVGINQVLENLSKMNLKAEDSLKLFGREGITSAGILIQNRKLVARWTKELKGTNSAQEQAAKRMATFETKARKLGIIIKGVLIRVFLKLEPMLSRIVDRMSEFFESITDKDINRFVKKFKEIQIVIGGVGAAIVESFKFIRIAIGKAMDLIDNFIFNLNTVLTKLGIIEKTQQKTVALPPRIAPTGDIPVEFLPKKLQKLQLLPPGIPEAPSFLGQKLDSPVDKSQTDININLRAPEGAIESVKTKTRSGKKLNVGLNMAPAT
jgi:TP901 family phage tail tape measure protein